MWEPRRGRVSGGGVHPPLLPRVVGESRGVFVLCWPGVTMWGSALLSPPGAKTRLATGSQGSGGWGQLGALHLHPHYHDTFLGWAYGGCPVRLAPCSHGISEHPHQPCPLSHQMVPLSPRLPWDTKVM